MVKKKKKVKKVLSKLFRKKPKKVVKKKAKVKKPVKKVKIKSPVKKVRKKTISKKVVKKPVKRQSKTKEEQFVVGFEEVVAKCPSCGRKFRVVKSSSFSMEGMLCQRCAAGGGVDFVDED